MNHKVAVSAKEKHKAALSTIAAAKQFQGYLLLHRRTENIGPHSAIPRVGPILPALYRPMFAVRPSDDCAGCAHFWKHNLARSAILWFKSQIEMTGDNAKRQRSPHGKVRCQPVGPSLILLGEVLTAP